MPRLSVTQLQVIERLTAPGADGVIVRWLGGFWAPPGTPWEWRKGGHGEQYRSPEWSVTIGTVQAMERMGLLRRLYRYPEEWRDDRELTDAWLSLGLGGGLEPNKSARVLEAERMQASGIRKTAQQKIGKIRERLAALDTQKRTALSLINTYARAARARTIIEPTTSVRGDRCQVVSADRSRELRTEVDAFYEAMRREVTGPIDEEEQLLREDIERTRDVTAIQTQSVRRTSGALRRMKRSEAASESDSEVEQSIDPGLLVVWKAVKRRIAGSAKMSRTEAFLHWVEENPDEVIAILADKLEPTDAELRRAQAEYDAAPDEEIPF